MRILAMETSDKTGAVAAIDDGNVLAELTLEQTQRSAQSLAPAMRDLLKQVAWNPSDVQLVAVSIGPGSFTGLRVGVTAAKVFAYAVGAEVLGVSTLEAIATNSGTAPILVSAKTGLSPSAQPEASRPVSVVIDAQRGEVVVQSFLQQPDGWFAAAGPEELLDADRWLEKLQAAISPLWKGTGASVTGPGLVRLIDRLPPGVEVVDRSLWTPRAAVVGLLAARYYGQGRRDDLWKLVPRYYRRSAAEEKWEARTAQP